MRTAPAPLPADEGRPTFYWWDDAIAVAQVRAWVTGLRQQVRRTRKGLWRVSEVGS